MNERVKSYIVFFLALSALFLPAAGASLKIKMRLYEGIRDETNAVSAHITSSYLGAGGMDIVLARFNPLHERLQIKKVYNLKDVWLITEANLEWDSRAREQKSHIFRLNGRTMFIGLKPAGPVSRRKFRIEVVDNTADEKVSLIETEASLPAEKAAVFGFEDGRGKPYFLAFHVPGTSPNFQQNEDNLKEFEKDAVLIEGGISPPKLLRKVQPEYPEEARRAKVQGVVILAARVNTQGKVADIRIVRGKDPHLNLAAETAVRKWEYEPYLVEGESRPVVFSVTVRFRLSDVRIQPLEKFSRGAVILDDKTPPRIIKKTAPEYPESARKKGIQGYVFLQVRLDREGKVTDAGVLQSESTYFNDAALRAVRSWIYTPFVKDGKPVEAVFVVTVKFLLTR
jgi:TonB family protein